MGHWLFSITYFLFIFLYVGTGLVWFGGWDWLLVLEKKQLSYIILFVCIWSEHNIFFPNVLALLISVFVSALKNETKKIRKNCINFYKL